MVFVVGSLYWPFLLYVFGALALTFGMIAVAALLGERHRERTTAERYESGLPPAGGMPERHSIEFYLVAIIFVVFDLEAVFIFAWAIAARDVGWAGYVEVAVFVLALLAGLAYAWANGLLEWGVAGRRQKVRRLP